MNPAQMQPPGYAWYKIREHFLFGQLDMFVRAIIDDTRMKGGKSIRDLPHNLIQFCFATEPPSRSLLFLLECVDYLASPHADTESNAVAHALLDCIPAILRSPFLQASYEQAILHRAANLFMRLLDGAYAKMAVKLVKGFSFSEITLWRALQPPGSSLSVVGAKNGPGISSKHLIACFRHDLAQHVFDLLEEKKTVTAAVDLAMQFRTMAREHFQNEGVLHRLLDIGQLPLAEQWAAQTSRPFVVQLVKVLVSRKNLKDACRIVKAHRLHEEFPDIEQQYQELLLERLMDTQAWPAAVNVVKDNTELQERLVARMAREQDADMALEYASMFGLDPSAAQVDESQLAASAAIRAATYLQLDLPDSAVLFIDSEERLGEAAALLEGAEVLGLDTEWQAPLENGNGSVHLNQQDQQHSQQQRQQVSILQLATKAHALIFDMPALHGNAVLDELLTKVMSSASIIKAGCGIKEDARMLWRSYPYMQAFRVTAGLLDLSKVSHSLESQPKSLTGIAEACLGKPLDKSMQISRWDRRPLTQRQLTYAALDAHVAVLIYDSLDNTAATFKADVQRSLLTIDHTKTEGRSNRGRNTNRTVYQPSTWI